MLGVLLKRFCSPQAKFCWGGLLLAVGEHFLVLFVRRRRTFCGCLLVCLEYVSFIMFTTDPVIRKTHYQISAP